LVEDTKNVKKTFERVFERGSVCSGLVTTLLGRLKREMASHNISTNSRKYMPTFLNCTARNTNKI